MAQGIVVVFDFDKTIIDCDSDDWVVNNFGLTQRFNTLLHTMPYNSLMDRMMEELHLQGTTIQEIADCLKKIPSSTNIMAAIKSAYASGCQLKIVSDANSFFIETILNFYGVLHCFSEINTNPAYVNKDDGLKILAYHDFKSSPHSCNVCPPNLCKGLVIEGFRGALEEKQFIYIGDGKNDYCPSLKLTATDYVMPRKYYPLCDVICSNIALIKAKVHEWNDGEELERTLINLINSLILSENHNLISEEILVDCKSLASPVSNTSSFQKTVQVPH